MEIGKSLREAREAKQLSLQETEEILKIRSKYLAALENENFADLPERVYARGFLRSYAQFLGLDSNALLEQFNAWEAVENPPPAKSPKRYEPVYSERSPRKKSWLGIGIGAVVVVILIWWIAAGINLSEQESQNPPPQIAQQQNETPVEAPPTEPEAPVAETPAPQIEGLELTLKANHDCWIQVTADGQTVRETILTPGNSESFKAQDSIKVQAGFGKGLEVELNGKNLGTFSNTDVSSREFTLADVDSNSNSPQ